MIALSFMEVEICECKYRISYSNFHQLFLQKLFIKLTIYEYKYGIILANCDICNRKIALSFMEVEICECKYRIS